MFYDVEFFAKILLAKTKDLSPKSLVAENGFVYENLACGNWICLRKLDLSVETGLVCEMDGSEFQELCTEDLCRWMRDKGVQECYCEVHVYLKVSVLYE